MKSRILQALDEFEKELTETISSEGEEFGAGMESLETLEEFFDRMKRQHSNFIQAIWNLNCRMWRLYNQKKHKTYPSLHVNFVIKNPDEVFGEGWDSRFPDGMSWGDRHGKAIDWVKKHFDLWGTDEGRKTIDILDIHVWEPEETWEKAKIEND